MAKNSAFEQGKAKALWYSMQVIVVSQQFWEDKAKAFANGHLSTSTAQAKFLEGWMSTNHPPFVEGDRVQLVVRIMNHSNPQVLERKMYDLIIPYQHSQIRFIAKSKICLKYQIEAGLATLNSPSCVNFLRDRQVSYEVLVAGTKNG